MTEASEAPAREFRPAEGRSFLQDVMERSGQSLTACYQCRRCAAGCPAAEAADGWTPDRLIRLVVLGDRDAALANPLIWKCVSCLTCGERCPNGIQTARIVDALKQMAKEAGVAPLNHKSVFLHDAFTDSALRWGRVSEVEFMAACELKNILYEAGQKNCRAVADELAARIQLGKSMFRRGRLHAKIQTIRGRGELRSLRRKGRHRTEARPAAGAERRA
ncbi:MAG: heterodisulfide reductase subunit C-like protein [Desulfobacterales bacterium]|nr:MAG: heterodisulfide reductase subunit C-like protein [Desulfobacterales bacterium]